MGLTVAVAVKDNFFSHFTANEGFFLTFSYVLMMLTGD